MGVNTNMKGSTILVISFLFNSHNDIEPERPREIEHFRNLKNNWSTVFT